MNVQGTPQRTRKGVSPLIAAVLLIAFTMAVAAILTAWVTTFTQEQTETVGKQGEQVVRCSSGALEILDTNSDSNELNISIANVGNVDFNNVTVTVLGSGSVVGSDVLGQFNSGDTTFSRVSLSGNPDSVRVSPQDCSSISVTKSNP